MTPLFPVETVKEVEATTRNADNFGAVRILTRDTCSRELSNSTSTTTGLLPTAPPCSRLGYDSSTLRRIHSSTAFQSRSPASIHG